MGTETGKSEEWLAAEQAFGCVFASFERLDAGNSSRNFRAATPDGRRFLVKFENEKRLARVLERLGRISSPLVPALAFGGATGHFGRNVICAIDWCDKGANIPPHSLTKAQLHGIVDGYQSLANALASVDSTHFTGWPGLDDAAKKCGLEPRPIHGDFHYRNFFVDGEKLSACFDLEFMRLGLPTEDLLRIFVHALERTRFWEVRRTNAIFRNFAALVGMSPYSATAWLCAIDLYERHKNDRRSAKKGVSAFAKIERILRSPLYRRLRRTVLQAKNP